MLHPRASPAPSTCQRIASLCPHDSYCIHRADTAAGSPAGGAWLFRYPNLAVNVYADGMNVEHRARRTGTDSTWCTTTSPGLRMTRRSSGWSRCPTSCSTRTRRSAGRPGQPRRRKYYTTGPLSPRHERGVQWFQQRVPRRVGTGVSAGLNPTIRRGVTSATRVDREHDRIWSCQWVAVGPDGRRREGGRPRPGRPRRRVGDRRARRRRRCGPSPTRAGTGAPSWSTADGPECGTPAGLDPLPVPRTGPTASTAGCGRRRTSTPDTACRADLAVARSASPTGAASCSCRLTPSAPPLPMQLGPASSGRGATRSRSCAAGPTLALQGRRQLEGHRRELQRVLPLRSRPPRAVRARAGLPPRRCGLDWDDGIPHRDGAWTFTSRVPRPARRSPASTRPSGSATRAS